MAANTINISAFYKKALHLHLTNKNIIFIMKPIVKNILTHTGIVLILLITSILFFRQLVTSNNKVLNQSDTRSWRGMVKEQKDFLKETGTYTHWNSAMFSGMPTYQITNKPQSSIFRIKDILILNKLGWAENIGVLFLYLIGFYICLVALGVNPWLSLIGALAFGLGSYNIIIIEAGHITKAWSLAMVAPIFSGIILTLKKKYLWGGILFTFALGAQIAFNHPQITYYTLLSVIILGLVYLIYAIKDKTFKDFGKAILVLVIGAIFAVGGNARLLMTNMEYAKYTMRGGSEITVTPDALKGDIEHSQDKNKSGLNKDYAFAWSYGIGETYTLLVPGSFGGGSNEPVDKSSKTYKNFKIKNAPLYWGDQPFTSGPVYFGAIIVFLFILGLFIVKGPERWWLLGITIMAIILSWGKNLMGLNGFLFDHLPMYNKFRTPSMSLVIANVAMVMMAILALKNIFSNEIDKKKLKIALYASTGITCGIILIVLILSGSFSFSGAVDEQMAAQYGDSWPRIQEIFIQDRQALFTKDSIRSLILILVSDGTLFFAVNLKNKIPTVAFVVTTVIIALLVTSDLWTVDSRYLNDSSYVSKKEMQLNPTENDKTIDQIAERFGDKDFRVMNLATSTFNDSHSAAFHHQIGGYHGAKLRRYQDLIDFYMMGELNMDVLNMLNARYFIVPDQQGSSMVQRNPAALGNAWFVDGCQIVDDANAEILALNDFNPADTAIIDKKFASYVEGKDLSRDTTSVIEMTHQKPYNPDYLVYSSYTDKDQLAVFSEVYYAPDWRAYIDGQPAEYFRVNYILRAMVIPAGQHKIEFINEAPMLKVWDGVSIAFSILLVLVIAGWIFLQYRKKKTETTEIVAKQ